MERKRISPTFDIDTYKQIENLAYKQGKDMAELVREWSIQGLNGQLVQENLEVIVPVLRQQLTSVLTPQFDRVMKLVSKTCVQAGAAAYLSAEAISNFVEDDRQQEVLESYEAARKKAVKYMQGNGNNNFE